MKDTPTRIINSIALAVACLALTGLIYSEADDYTHHHHATQTVHLIKSASIPRAALGSPTRCQTQSTGCASYVLGLMNQERASQGIPPLTLNWTMSRGTSTCIGAAGNAKSMRDAGFISHSHFAADVCSSFQSAGENVGEASGSKYQAITMIHEQMKAEPYSPGCSNHHCNWLSRTFTHVGIGFSSNGSTWFLSEEFAG